MVGGLFDQQDGQLASDFTKGFDQLGVVVRMDVDTATVACQLTHGGLIGTGAECNGVNGNIHLLGLRNDVGRMNTGIVVSVGHDDHRSQRKRPSLRVAKTGQASLHAASDGGQATGAQLTQASIDRLQIGGHLDFFAGVGVVDRHGATLVLGSLFQFLNKDANGID